MILSEKLTLQRCYQLVMNITYSELRCSETAQRKAWGDILVTVSAGWAFFLPMQISKVQSDPYGAAAVFYVNTHQRTVFPLHFTESGREGRDRERERH